MPTPTKPAVTPREFPIARATAADLPEIKQLLAAADLPSDDLGGGRVQFLVARTPGGSVAGSVGADVQDADAVLRSLVVAPEYRHVGLGGRLVAALEGQAARWGVARWWLLTMSAEPFFAARGFAVVPRASAPPAIQQTSLFATHCCGQAVCMTRARRAE